VNYLGRYTHRVAISNNRLTACDDGKVSFKYRDYADIVAVRFAYRFRRKRRKTQRSATAPFPPKPRRKSLRSFFPKSFAFWEPFSGLGGFAANCPPLGAENSELRPFGAARQKGSNHALQTLNEHPVFLPARNL
jgi:hypothetical protein